MVTKHVTCEMTGSYSPIPIADLKDAHLIIPIPDSLIEYEN